MTGAGDLLVDRRRLKRRLAFWRASAFLAVAALAVATLGPAVPLPGARHIAVVAVEGIVFGDPERERAVRAIADDDSAAALIVNIDSPGGATFASEALYRSIRAVGESKPVVAVMHGVAASGGYMAALGADRILARESTITGSIGVMLEATNFAGLMEKVGVESELVRSGPLKGEPSPFAPMTPRARDAARRVVDELHAMFVRLVSDRRALAPAEASRLADGRVYTGAMAAEAGLIDGLGGVAEAVAWLEEESGVAAGLPLVEISTGGREGLLARLVSAVVGDAVLAGSIEPFRALSIWRPHAQ